MSQSALHSLSIWVWRMTHRINRERQTPTHAATSGAGFIRRKRPAGYWQKTEAVQIKLLTFWEIEKILKHEVERRSRLDESFDPPHKVHWPIVTGSNARLISAPVSDDFGNSHLRLMHQSNEFWIHYHDYREFCFHNCLWGMASSSWNEKFSRYCVIE
jgi:hypothetical protein